MTGVDLSPTARGWQRVLKLSAAKRRLSMEQVQVLCDKAGTAAEMRD
jgi:hypothetical protein